MLNEFFNGGGTGSTDYIIERSLRLESGDSSYLAKTCASAGNRKIWTWSGWIKRTGTSGYFLGGGNGANNRMDFNFNADGQIELFSRSGSSTIRADLRTEASFRDFGAWYHIVIAFNAVKFSAKDRIKIYVNGVDQPLSVTTAVVNTKHEINNTLGDYIGTRMDQAVFADAYLADVHFIDGQALDETDFGEYDDNGVWQPKAYRGTYGGNGYHLDFSDNSSNAALGYDAAGSNDWTVNNLEAGTDSLLDTPTNYETEVGNNGGNYATLNPLNSDSNTVFSNGNLTLNKTGTTGYGTCNHTIGVSSDKWYCEYTLSGDEQTVGIARASTSVTTSSYMHNSGGVGYYSGNGWIYYQGSSSITYGATFTTGDTIGIALDLDNGKIFFSKNGIFQNSGEPVAGTNPAVSGLNDTYVFGLNAGDPTSTVITNSP